MTNTSSFSLTRLLGVLLSLVVVASACGDDGGDSAGGGDFCELAAQQDALADELSFGDSPEDIEAFYAEQRRLTAAGIAAAPNDQVKADLETLAGGVAAIMAALSEVDWNFMALSEEAMAALDSPEFDAAADRIDAYVESACGIDTGGDGAEPDATDLGGDLGPDLGTDLGDLEDLPLPDLGNMGANLTGQQMACLVTELGAGALGEIMAAAFTGQEIDGADLALLAECGIDPDQFG